MSLKIADSSRILFNVGLIHANIGDHASAVAYYQQARQLDQYFAISYFQSGVSYFLLQNYSSAAQSFQEAYVNMRDNSVIDYEQIGLNFKLCAAEILFNEGLAYLGMQQADQGMQLLDRARREKQVDEHEIMEEAYINYGKNCTVFSVPTGMLFRPSEVKVKNLKAKNYLGQAKLVAATSPGDAYVGFSGIGAKSTFASETNTPITPTELNRQSPPPLSTKPALSPTATAAIVAPLEESSITPLKLTRKKSSAELLGGPGPSLPMRPRAATANAMAKLPRIDTDVFCPSFAHHTSSSYSPPLLKNVPTINVPMPPTPPESEKSKTITPLDRRDTAATTLGYLQDHQKPYTDYVDEIVDGYAGIDVNAGRRRPSLPAHSPYPRGQPLERVAKWANNQIDTVDSGTASRYASPSAPSSKHGSNPSPISRPSGQGSISYTSPGPSVNASLGTLRRYPTSRRAAENVHSLRRGSLDDYLNPSLASRDGIDDPLSIRSNSMFSFRLKLHFENDVRGMSLHADTLLPEFYARLQSKFGIADMSLKYKDEDGTFVTIVDEDDWDSAIDAARENCHSGRMDGKLDIWIMEGRPH